MDPLTEERFNKLENLKKRGINPYPNRYESTHQIGEITSKFEKLEAGHHGGQWVKIAGRITSLRPMGKVTFFDLRDFTDQIQGYGNLDKLKKKYDLLNDLDVGDFIGCEGEVFKTKRGELSVLLDDFHLLAKALRPLPEKWHGLKDVETRYRKRYLDLIANEKVRDIFIKRSRIIQVMRKFLDRRNFLEVETPILQPIYGGASARPFKTYHNTLDQEFYLRISNELYLKRLVIGGLGKVYEIGKDFRNEGISTQHNPEFTQMECYSPYFDYQDMMKLVEEMIPYIAQSVLGQTTITYQGHRIDLENKWSRISLQKALYGKLGIDIGDYESKEDLEKDLKVRGIDFACQPSYGKLVDELFSEYVEESLIDPTFIIDYPVEISPLAKKKEGQKRWVERFEPFIGGLELGNAFTELNDPLDQRERFAQQEKMKEMGDEEAQAYDEDFLTAMEYGMPPTGGLGIGIDRLVMLLTDSSSIKEVVLFPTLRTKK